MLPPATTLDEKPSISFESKPNGYNRKARCTNGNTVGILNISQPSDDILDMLCVGFGPASLAIAIALDDSYKTILPNVLFLERDHKFSWHSGMQIPDAKMQISFLKDLATPRNPRSNFTFINYLFAKKRLHQFINLSTHYPSRLEYEDYLRWCASYFEMKGVVQYGMNVQRICVGSKNTDGKITCWKVSVLDSDGNHLTKRTRNVVIAVGGSPMLPKELKGAKDVIHSSQYISSVKKILDQGAHCKQRFAVVGAGQSAAEIFNDLWSRFPESNIWLIIKGASLRPSDDSPFVNEIFDPDRVDDIFAQPSTQRAASLILDRGTNYGVVRQALLEHLYEKLYVQRLVTPLPSQWKARILNNRIIVNACRKLDGSSMLLTLNDLHSHSNEEILEVDYVFAATGYLSNAHENILAELKPLLPNGIEDNEISWPVQRDYRVLFDTDKLESNVGIWLQGCNERTHGPSDTLLSILAIRGGELVNSIFGA